MAMSILLKSQADRILARDRHVNGSQKVINSPGEGLLWKEGWSREQHVVGNHDGCQSLAR
jgi:hypothetical protein